MNDSIGENSKNKISKLDDLADINQKITFCSELLNEKLSTNSDPKISEILKILERASVRLTEHIVSLKDELDK